MTTSYDIEIEDINEDIKYLEKQQSKTESDEQFNTIEIKLDELRDRIKYLEEAKETAIKNCGYYSDDDLGI